MQPAGRLAPRFREDDKFTRILILLKIYVELRFFSKEGNKWKQLPHESEARLSDFERRWVQLENKVDSIFKWMATKEDISKRFIMRLELIVK